MYLLVTGLFKVWVVPADPFGGDGTWRVGEHFWHWLGIVFVARFALLHVHLLLSVPLLAPDADLASG